MSNNSSGSSSLSRARSLVHGIPRICWCGESVKEFISKTDANPGRRFYRCHLAEDRKLKTDGSHVFKWSDEAFVEERELVDEKAKTLVEELEVMKEIISESLENGKKVLKKMELDIEERLLNKIEDAMLDAKSSLRNNMFVFLVIGCLTVMVFSLFFHL